MNVVLFEIGQKIPEIWASFVRKFVTKKFKKLPNLVTLHMTKVHHHTNTDTASVFS